VKDRIAKAETDRIDKAEKYRIDKAEKDRIMTEEAARIMTAEADSKRNIDDKRHRMRNRQSSRRSFGRSGSRRSFGRSGSRRSFGRSGSRRSFRGFKPPKIPNWSNKREGFTISTSEYATLDDVRINLSDISKQVDKISIVEGIDNDDKINEINKELIYITQSLEQISSSPTVKSNDEPTNNDGFHTQLNSSEYNGSTNTNSMRLLDNVYSNQNTVSHVMDERERYIKNNNAKSSENTETTDDMSDDTEFINKTLINQITLGAFSIVGLYIVYRGLKRIRK
jgi:hypothetical protein